MLGIKDFYLCARSRITLFKSREMKKVSLFFASLAMVAFVACNNGAEETVEDATEETMETTEETMEEAEEAAEETMEEVEEAVDSTMEAADEAMEEGEATMEEAM